MSDRRRWCRAVAVAGLVVPAMGAEACPDWDEVALKLCDAESGIVRWQVRSTDWLPFVAIASDGAAIVTASYSGTITRWNPTAGTRQRTTALGADRTDRHQFVLSPDVALIVEGGYHEGVPNYGDAITLWRSEDGTKVAAVGQSVDRSFVAFSADSRRLLLLGPSSDRRVTALEGEWIDVAKPAVGTPVRVQTPASAVPIAGSLSPDNRHLIIGDSKGRAWLVDLQGDHAAVELIGHTRALSAVAYLAAGRDAATVGYDRTLIRWDLQSGQPRWRRSIAKDRWLDDFVTSVAASADGRFLVTGAQSGRARVWDASDGRLVATIPGAGRWTPVFLPDGRSFVLAGTGVKPRGH